MLLVVVFLFLQKGVAKKVHKEVEAGEKKRVERLARQIHLETMLNIHAAWISVYSLLFVFTLSFLGRYLHHRARLSFFRIKKKTTAPLANYLNDIVVQFAPEGEREKSASASKHPKRELPQGMRRKVVYTRAGPI